MEAFFTPPIYPRCPECKYLLGAVFRAIDYCRLGYMISLVNDVPDRVKLAKVARLMNTGTEPIGWILDAFGINNACCRMHIIGHMDPERTF